MSNLTSPCGVSAPGHVTEEEQLGRLRVQLFFIFLCHDDNGASTSCAARCGTGSAPGDVLGLCPYCVSVALCSARTAHNDCDAGLRTVFFFTFCVSPKRAQASLPPPEIQQIQTLCDVRHCVTEITHHAHRNTYRRHPRIQSLFRDINKKRVCLETARIIVPGYRLGEGSPRYCAEVASEGSLAMSLQAQSKEMQSPKCREIQAALSGAVLQRTTPGSARCSTPAQLFGTVLGAVSLEVLLAVHGRVLPYDCQKFGWKEKSEIFEAPGQILKFRNDLMGHNTDLIVPRDESHLVNNLQFLVRTAACRVD